MINWKHIKDEQPEHDRYIIHVDPPYEGYYTMGMRKYYQPHSFEELLEFCEKMECPFPDYWWVYAEDFPFPDKKIIFRCDECKKYPQLEKLND